jgi:hypothetical protein
MRNGPLFLRIGGALLLFTFLGHTMGTFMEIPPEQTAVANAANVMTQTLVPMPVGPARSYADIFLGTNLAVSLYLLIAAISFLMFAQPGGLEGAGRKLLALTSVGVAAFGVISLLYFFPIPAACGGLAAVAGFIAARTR